MYLRHSKRTKNGKTHTYWRLVKSERVDGKVRQVTVAQLGELDAKGRAKASELAKRMLEKTPPDLSKFLLSPMPGLLVRLNMDKGDEIKAGEELAVVEAMKMENSLRATEDVTIAKIFAKQGETLTVDQPILEFE